MNKILCGVLAFVIMASVTVKASEPAAFEVKTRNSIGMMGIVKVPLTVKEEADGSTTVSFQAPNTATYVISYKGGPNNGKAAATVTAKMPGPVTVKIKPVKK